MVHTRSNREIEKIAISCQIVADTLIMLEPHIVEGICVADLDRMAEDYIKSQGARPAFKGYMGFPATLCVSIDDAVVHGIPGEDILKQGQIVGIDCGAELDGYYGDHARSFAVGEITADKEKLPQKPMRLNQAMSLLLEYYQYIQLFSFLVLPLV